ncbi:MAG: class II aldolase/adducin family protein [Bdellovibrionota bacterium]
MTSYGLRKEMIRYAHRLDAKGFVANHDGNLSARMGDETRFLATPTARAKFDLKESDLIVVDQTGKTKAGAGRIFSEWAYHSEIYAQLPSTKCVVHAHPPFASSYALAAQALPLDFWPEAVVSLGLFVPCISPAAGSESVPRVGAAARVASACLVQGNGIFAWGDSIEQAYLRLELVEHLAQIYALAQRSGTLRHLPSDALQELMQKRKKAGLLAPEERIHG